MFVLPVLAAAVSITVVAALLAAADVCKSSSSFSVRGNRSRSGNSSGKAFVVVGVVVKVVRVVV